MDRARLRTIETTLGLLGLLLSFAGMGAIFWHLAWDAAVVFLLVSTPALVYVAYILLVYALHQHDELEGKTDKAKRSPQD
jgi:multisubunit Na+/H+ antiporter MnhG subunit